MFVQVMFLFAWIAAMQCTAIANPVLCPYGSATECHEGLRLRHKEIVNYAVGLVHSAAEQSGSDLNNKPASDAANQINKFLDDSKKAQEDATAAEKNDKERAVNAKKEVEKAEEEIKKHKTPSTSGYSWWGTPTRTPVFQWDEAFIETAKGYADSASEKAAVAKNKADEAVKMAEALQNTQSTIHSDAEAVGKTQQEYLSIEESIKEANNAILGVKKHADAAEIAAYYVKTMVVSHSVFKTVENITYMSTKSKSLTKEAEDGLEEAASYLDVIPREYVTEVKNFMKPIKALVHPLKELQVTSERAVKYTKTLQTIINEDKERMKDIKSVREAKCTWERASAAAVLINAVAEPVKSKTPFLNGAIEKVGASKAKGLAARFAYTMWSWSASAEDIKKIEEAVTKEKEEERKKREDRSHAPPPPPPLVNKLFNPSINIPSEVNLPDCNAGKSKGEQTVNLDAINPKSDLEDSTVPMEGDGQERNATASGASGSNGERKGDKGESFRTEEQTASGGDISTKEPVDDEGIHPVDSTESNEFRDNDSSKRSPQKGGYRDSASTILSACAYALLTFIMFLITVQR